MHATLSAPAPHSFAACLLLVNRVGSESAGAAGSQQQQHESAVEVSSQAAGAVHSSAAGVAATTDVWVGSQQVWLTVREYSSPQRGPVRYVPKQGGSGGGADKHAPKP